MSVSLAAGLGLVDETVPAVVCGPTIVAEVAPLGIVGVRPVVEV